MKIIYTDVNLDYSGGYSKPLSVALVNAIAPAASVAEEFKNREDGRTLVIVLGCPCCDYRIVRKVLDVEKNVVMVTPFHGMDHHGLQIHEVSKHPPVPNGHLGDRAFATIEGYLGDFRKTIEQALAS